MILGQVIDLAPRVKLTLQGISSPVEVDFIIDTGFEGEIALPEHIVNRLAVSYLGARGYMTAGGGESEGAGYVANLDRNDNPARYRF